MYVVKQKYTTTNVVIYSDISLCYYQKFFFVVIVQIYFFINNFITKTPNLIGGQVVHFCLTTYNFCLGLPVLQSCIAIHYLQVLSPKLKMMLLIDPALLYHTSIHSSFI